MQSTAVGELNISDVYPAHFLNLYDCSSISVSAAKKRGRVLPVQGWWGRRSRFNSEALKKSVLYCLYDEEEFRHTDTQVVRVARPHPRNKRSSAWDGQKRTSVSSKTWFCRPSSPGDPCTSSRWGWWRGRCRCCGLRIPRGCAGQTPVSDWADSGSLDGPVERGFWCVLMI